MTQEHPITPPPELVTEWWSKCTATSDHLIRQLATHAARWGADQELKACCEWLLDHGYDLCSPEMRKDRRPKLPSLKEQALEALNKIEDNKATYLDSSIIRRALEQLND